MGITRSYLEWRYERMNDIDEFGLWSRVLTASEIDALFNNGTSRPFSEFGGQGGGPSLLTGLVSHYSMVGSFINNLDSSITTTQTFDAKVSGTPALSSQAEFYLIAPKGIDHQTGNGFSSLTMDGISAGDAFSVSFWYKVNSNSASANQHGLSSANNSISSSFHIAGNGSLSVFPVLPSPGGTGSSVTIADVTFIHYVLTTTGTQATWYINAISEHAGTVVTGDFPSPNMFFTWDLDSNARALDEVACWSKELTSSEVSLLYNGGSGLAYPFS